MKKFTEISNYLKVENNIYNMKYLKGFNEHNGVKVDGINITDQKWENILPKSLTIITDNGTFTLKRDGNLNKMGHVGNISDLNDNVQIVYYQNTLDKNPNPTADGEPDILEIDLWIMKENNGKDADPKSIKLNVDITYGDSMASSFTISDVNKVKVIHYTGKNSKYDPNTFFGFEDDSLEGLVNFFNKFGFEVSVDDFKFIDRDLESYHYKNPKIEGDNRDIKSMSKSNRQDIKDLKGGDLVNKEFDIKESKIMKGQMSKQHRKNIVRKARRMINYEVKDFNTLPVGQQETIQDDYIEKVCIEMGWELTDFYHTSAVEIGKLLYWD